MRSPLTTHVLDTARGRPAEGLEIVLERLDGGQGHELARGSTDADGRLGTLLRPGELTPGVYRLTFLTGAWFSSRGQRGFYPSVPVVFEITATDEHYHVPLLLSPFGYSTYRGS